MRRLANRWQLLFRDNHRAIVKRDQVPRHPTTLSPLRLPLVDISSASSCNRHLPLCFPIQRGQLMAALPPPFVPADKPASQKEEYPRE
jgi:hypothetical protein